MADPNSLENLSAEQRAELNVGKLTAQLLRNPETREATARLLKKQDPNLVFTDLDAKDEARKEREKSQEAISALEKRLLEGEARAKLAEYHAMIRDAGFDVKAVNELMEKVGIPATKEGYEHVIKHLRAEQNLAEPTPETFAPLQIPNVKEMWENPVAWREKEAYKVQAELIQGRRGTRTQ